MPELGDDFRKTPPPRDLHQVDQVLDDGKQPVVPTVLEQN